MTITSKGHASALQLRRPRRRTPASAASAATARGGSSPTTRSSSASTPPTSGSASAPASSSARGPARASPSSTCRCSPPRPALERAGIEGSDLDAIIVATVSWPYQTPGAAPLVAERRSGSTAAALDISAACAGYCHGIALANDLMRGGTAEYVLVIGVERLSDFTEPRRPRHRVPPRRRRRRRRDRPLRDRPASARPSGARTARSGTRSAERDAGSRCTSRSRLAAHRHAGPDGLPLGRVGDGHRSPSRRSTRPVSRVDDLDAFIPHQANMRIIDEMAKQLKLPEPTWRSRATSRHRQHVGGLDPAGDGPDARSSPRCPAAASPCRSASAPVSSSARRSSSCPDAQLPLGPRRAPGPIRHPEKRRRSTAMAFSSDRRSSPVWPRLINDETGIAPAEVAARTSRSPTTSTSTRSR